MATELATAYISILPSTSKLGDEIGKYLGKTEQQSEESGKKSGNRFSAAFGKWAKRALAAGGVAVGAVAGAAIVSGFKSAVDQQQGQKVLSGLYGDAEKASSTLKGLRDMSKKSPIEYSSYQSAAESLAYAGAEGDEAIGVLNNMGKAITAAGGDSSNLDSATDAILKGVNAGKFQLDTLQQLSNAGIPILSGLAEHFGVSIGEVNKMASAGKVSLEDVMSVLQKGEGETFQQMIKAGDAASTSFGNQWKMAKDNIQVALGQVLLPLLDQITPMIEPLGNAVVGAIEKIPDLAAKISDGFKWIQDNWSWIKPFAFIIGGIAAAFAGYSLAMGVAAAATTAWGVAVEFATAPINIWIVAIGLLVGALIWFFTQTEIGQRIWSAAWAAIKVAVSAVVDWFQNTAWPILKTILGAIGDAAVWLYQNAILPAWNGIKTAIGAVIGWFTGTAWPALQVAWNAVASAAVWLWQSVMMPAWNGIKGAISAVSGWVTGSLVPALSAAWTAIGSAASWLYTSIIKPVWTAIKVIIAIVITAVLLQVKAWVWFFQNVVAPVFTWLYKTIIKPVWQAIKKAIGSVVSWFQGTAWPIIQSVINAIKTAFSVLRSTLSTVWKFIQKNVIAPVVTWFRDTAWPIVRAVIDAIKSAFTVMRDKLSSIWSFVKNSVIKPVVNWFRDTAKTIFTNTIDKLKNAFTGLKDRLSSLWSSIKTKIIKPVADWFRDTVRPLFDTATGKIKDAFTSLKAAVKKAWNGIRDTAKTPVEFVVNKVINGAIIATYNDVAHGMFGLDKVSDVSLPAGWARGGVLPGYTPMRKGDDVLTPMRSGEGVLVSEGLRDRRSKRLFLGANEAAKRGTSFADFVGGGYAGGGLVKLRMPFAGTHSRGEGFGARGGKHKGIDFPMPAGTVLKAVAAGDVHHSWNPSAGKKLELSIGNGLVAGYHHLSSYIAGNGAKVGRGSDIARAGSTGHSTGPHLHFSIKKDGTYVDPAPYLGAAGGEAGEGKSSWWNPFSGLWSSIKSTLRDGVGDTAWGDVLFAMPKKLVDGAVDWAKDKLSSALDFGGGGSTAGVEQWRSVATQALNMTGQYSASNLQALLRRMKQESGGDPNAINNWDSNAKRGTPSKGLMQVIDPTFRAYAMSGYDTNIWDPLSNILASIRYAVSTYGSLSSAYNRSGGYAAGGIVKPFLHDNGGRLDPGVSVIANKTRKPEAILTDAQWRTMHSLAERNLASDGGQLVIYGGVHGHSAEDVAREIERDRRKAAALRPRIR